MTVTHGAVAARTWLWAVLPLGLVVTAAVFHAGADVALSFGLACCAAA
jgi:hypothetical protein